MERLVPLKPLSRSYRLGWSHSRYETFQNCKRLYYYTYYTRFDTEFPRERLQLLKGLSSVPLAVGDIAHRTIEKILTRLVTTEVPIDRERLDAYIRGLIHTDVIRKTFFETYYRKLVAIDEEEIFEKIRICVHNFLDSDRFRWVLEEGVAFKQNWIIEPPGFGETVIEGSKAYAKFDFLYRDDRRILIFDWKTGNEDVQKHVKQLRAYSYWASYHLDADPKSVIPVIAYLYPEYREIECDFDEEHFKEFAASVREQIADMESYCEDVNANRPMPKEAFPMKEYSRFCDHCNFNELCWGEKE